MPILNFTPADALQTVVMEAGGYSAVLAKIEGPKASGTGKSVNYFVTFRITAAGKYHGKELDIVANSEMNSASLLGERQFYPENIFLVIDAAINNKKVEAINQSIDTDNLIEKPLDLIVAVTTVDGRLINVINNFVPAGTANAASPF